MPFLRSSAVALAAAAALAACKSTEPIPHTPTHLVMVSGANQSAGVSQALDSMLVVQVLDGANRPVANVPLAWTVTGGGTVSAVSTTTDAQGKSSVSWTLAPVTGTQVVTVTSTQIVGGSVSFVANNGAVISGNVTLGNGLAYGYGSTFSRVRAGGPRLTTTRAQPARRFTGRIVVGFRNDVLGVAAAGSGAYRSISVARSAYARLQDRVTALTRLRPLSHAELSPAMLAARLRVDDTTQTAALMAQLAADPSVAWVEPDGIMSVRDGAPKPVSAEQIVKLASAVTRSGVAAAATGTRLPNDPLYYAQWGANMVDLPKAWAITTGSTSVTVAVVDMGVRFDHPDIGSKFTNDGYDFVSQIGYGTTERYCDGGTFTTIDGDGDGPDPDPTDPDDLEFDSADNCWVHNPLGDHGLWTSGIIGASGDNGAGVTGVNWNVRIRPVRALGTTGDGSYFDIAQAILYAAGLPATGAGDSLVQAKTGAQIINMSFGASAPSSTLASAITAASNSGSLLIAAAGNDGLDELNYPAAYPEVMAVAAVGQDGLLATYSSAGTDISVAAPGGDFRLDDAFNGGGGVLGPGWDFQRNAPVYLLGFGTSGAAPYVSGVAALILAQNPGLTAAQLRQRIEQYATRPPGGGRTDLLGWGIVNAYDALTQQAGAPRRTYARLIDAVTGATVKTVPADASGNFAFTKLSQGAYYVQAGEDESADSTLGVPGRRFGWAGGFGKPTVFNVSGQTQGTAILLGIPTEVEPNDDVATANLLTPGSYVVGQITPPDARDVYAVVIPTTGTYTFATSGVVGTCGLGTELDTYLTLTNQAGTTLGSNDNTQTGSGPFCSSVQATLVPGIYYVTVTGTSDNGLASRGRYRLAVRASP
ncbi:MAG TPA: S8 family serine peptidase [Gemmatimonadaceae bacterium]|nr:S8 family serine peptidase [Gemmatimonadaceae bacterium]